jgi:hypothetical protein
VSRESERQDALDRLAQTSVQLVVVQAEHMAAVVALLDAERQEES